MLPRILPAYPFVPYEEHGWNADPVVLRHELGHATIWFYYGGGIGRLLLQRSSDGLLEPCCKSAPSSPTQEVTPEFIDAVAERLLAGEVAARIHLGLQPDQVTLRKLTSNYFQMGIRAIDVAQTMSESTREDVYRVLDLADQYHPDDWQEWIRLRLASCEEVLHQYWSILEGAAVRFTPAIPRRWGTCVEVPGPRLVQVFSELGMEFKGNPPIPI